MTTTPGDTTIDARVVKLLSEMITSVQSAIERSGDPAAAADFEMLLETAHTAITVPSGVTAPRLRAALKHWINANRSTPVDPEIHK